MHGLTFIAKIWGITITDIAERLGVSKQTATDWVKGRGKINKERLEKLSEMFGGIDCFYLTKDELNATDMIAIKLHYLGCLAKRDSYEEEYVFLDDEGNECPDVRIVNPYEEEIIYLSDLKMRKELVEKIETQILIEHEFSADYDIYLLFSDMTKLIIENDHKKIWLINTVFEYLLFWKKGLHMPEDHYALIEDLDMILERHFKG